MQPTPLLHSAIATSLCAATLALASPAAQAVTVYRTDEFTAAGMCVPATFTVSKVRNRPTGVRNESTSALYVTCSAPAEWFTPNTNKIYLQVANFGVADATLNCTLMTGYPVGAANTTSQGTYPQTAVVTAGAGNYFTWDSTTLTGTASNLLNPSFSCLLPPGTEVRAYWREYNEDVGA